jgi:hypothetical protein
MYDKSGDEDDGMDDESGDEGDGMDDESGDGEMEMEMEGDYGLASLRLSEEEAIEQQSLEGDDLHKLIADQLLASDDTKLLSDEVRRLGYFPDWKERETMARSLCYPLIIH